MDLEKLETVSVNRVAEELKEKLREQEERNIKDLHNYDVSSFNPYFLFCKMLKMWTHLS